MKTVVYPLAKQIDYTELKYSLRSIDKFLPGYEVVLVGETVPDWITNITHIEVPDIQGRPVYSVRRKVIAALNYTDEFLFMNDDFYLLKPFDFKFYSSGTLKGKAESGAKPLYEQLKQLDKPTNYYGHYPAFYKKDFISVIENFTPECITKSAYLNFIGVEPTEVPDCKIMNPVKPREIGIFISDKPCLSTGPNSIKSVIPVLEQLFPNPSQFEI